MNFKLIILTIGVTLGLVGCNSGLNRKLDTGSGADAYHLSLSAAVRDMKKEEIVAFDWAASFLSIDDINEQYPNGTPREIIHGVAGKILENGPKLLEENQEKTKIYEKELEEIGSGIKVIASTISFPRDSFSDSAVIKAKIKNSSAISLTDIKWRVELYINNSEEPVASTTQWDFYKSDGGIKAGHEYSRTFYLDDSRFTTLEIQNAAKREIRFTLLTDECEELNGKKLGDRDPSSKSASIIKLMSKATAYQNI